MTPRQALVAAAVALLIALAILLEWTALPSGLQSAGSTPVSVTAHFVAGKGGRAVLVHASGWQAHVHCGKAPALCQQLQARPNQAVDVRLVRVGMLDDIWLSSAVVEGHEWVHLDEQEHAFGRSKAIHLALASVFLAAAAAFGAFARTGMRGAGQNAA